MSARLHLCAFRCLSDVSGGGCLGTPGMVSCHCSDSYDAASAHDPDLLAAPGMRRWRMGSVEGTDRADMGCRGRGVTRARHLTCAVVGGDSGRLSSPVSPHSASPHWYGRGRAHKEGAGPRPALPAPPPLPHHSSSPRLFYMAEPASCFFTPMPSCTPCL